MEKICMKNTQVSFRDCLKKQTKKRIEAASTKHQAPSFKLDNCAQWDYKGCRKKEICKQ